MPTRTGVRIQIDYDLPMAAPDGIVLSADVFRPAIGSRHPAILVRTPYNKLAAPAQLGAYGFDPLAAVRSGYALVFQDCRGRFASGGRFRHFQTEADDGAAAVAWVASQPWSDGAVAMAGASYVGATQLLAATKGPPALKAIAPFDTGSEYYDGFIYQGGAFQLGFALRWSLDMASSDLAHRERLGEDVAARRELATAIAADPSAAFSSMPPMSLGPMQALGEPAGVLSNYQEWLEHPDRDDFWRSTAINERYASIDVPALHITNWYDIFLKGALENYVGLRDGAASARARSGQRLVIGPSSHGPANDAMADIWLGPEAVGLSEDCLSFHLGFFDTFLKGSPRPERPPVRLFTMGENRWHDEDDWPPHDAVPTCFHLRSGGRLTRERPADESPDEYVYDPHAPVPTSGGATCLFQPFLTGPRDRRAIHDRADVLVYTTDPLVRDLDVTGPVTATLHVATSARDTDFTVALVDVHADGSAIGIADGILRLRYRDGLDTQHMAEPGRPYQIRVDLIATSNLFVAGHRIAVEISSSNFPRFDRNPNHGGPIAEARESDIVEARQTIFHDAERPSFISLPARHGRT